MRLLNKKSFKHIFMMLGAKWTFYNPLKLKKVQCAV